VSETYARTMVVWWRFGREHGGERFECNPPEVIEAHIQRKADRFRRTPADAWRWWQVDQDLIIERPPASEPLFGADSRIYYLLNRGLSVIKNICYPPPDDCWKWHIHIADFPYDQARECWLMKDLFCDIVVAPDDRTFKVLDLPDVAQALDVGLISHPESREILRRVSWVVNEISRRAFPFAEVQRAEAAARRLGWE